MVKNLLANPGDPSLIPELGKILWRRNWQPTPVFLSGEFHGQKSLAVHGCHKESDMTDRLNSNPSAALAFMEEKH